MSKIWLKIFLALPLVLLIGWTLTLYVYKEKGQEVRLPIYGYDPVDLLSGHYLNFTIDWKNADCRQFSDGICPEKDFCKEGRMSRACRFYVPEEYAFELDKLLFQNRSSSRKFELVYSYNKGVAPMAKELLIDGKPWRKSLQKKNK